MAADTPNLPPADSGRSRKVSSRDRLPVLWALAGLGMASVMTQLALMRELLCAFAGNEMVLGIALGLWLLLTGLGTSLGRTADKLRNPLAVLFTAQILIAVIPLAQVFAVRALRNVVFVRGAEVGVTGTVLSAAVLLLPFCLVAGYTLTLACSILNRRGDASGAGRVYVADSLGSVAGGALFSFVLVRFLDHIALLAVPALLNLAAAVWLGQSRGQHFPPDPMATLERRSPIRRVSENTQDLPGRRPALREIFILTLAAGIAAFVWLAHSDALSTALQFPGQNVLFRANSPYGRLVVTESGGETNFIENGIAVVSTPNVEQVEEAAHYAMAQRPDARRVLLVSGGVAGVAKEILKYNVAGVDCVELDPLVIETGRRFLPEHFADPRIHVIATDARQFVRQTTNRYDVVILALPDPSTAQLNRFFTVEFFSGVKRVLADGGVLSFALGRYENYVSPELAQLLASAHRSLQAVVRQHSGVARRPGLLPRVRWPAAWRHRRAGRSAGRSDEAREPALSRRHAHRRPDGGHPAGGVATRRAEPGFQSDALLLPPAPLDEPVHLELRRAASGAVAVAARVSHSTVRGGPALVLFASGFAGSALEVVLLLAFQVLCGSVYHQVGVIVTVFMVGLAVGAVWANRCSQRERRL